MTDPLLPTSPEFGASLASLAASTPETLGLASPSQADVRLLGHGESYVAWRLDVEPASIPAPARETGVSSIVVRAAARDDVAPRSPAAEFAALQLAPAGLGPHPLALVAADENPTGRLLMVQGFVPGRVLPPSSWTDELLRAHASQLAALHEPRHPRCRALLDDAGSDVMDPVHTFDASVTYWQETRPDLLERGGPAKLLEPLREYVMEARPAFAGMTFALIHGDAANANILVGQNRPRYVDWEWSEIGDPARDLALLGAPVGASPWFLTLDDAREQLLLDAYVEAGGARDGDDVARLRTRRRAHEAMEQFFTAVHYLGRLDLHPPAGAPPVGGDPLDARQRPVYENGARNMFLSVQARLLRHDA